MQPLILRGPVHTWRYLGHDRVTSSLVLPFRDAVRLMRVRPFDAATQFGEQRDQTLAHARELSRAIREGEFTPTPWAANVPATLQDGVKIIRGPDGGYSFELEIPPDNLLAQTDGGHRRAALCLLLQHHRDELAKAEKKRADDLAEVHRAAIADIDALPIDVKLYLDGDPKLDFCRLQKSRPVDATLLYTLKAAADQFDDQTNLVALDIARVLNADNRSPFYGVVRFDCLKKGPAKLELPFKTLTAEGKSDLSTSLKGLALVGGYCDLTSKRMADRVVQAYQSIADRRPALLQTGSVLTPFSQGGKRGQSTMWVGLAICLAFRAGRKEPSREDLNDLAEAAWETLRDPPLRNFSAATKRSLIGDFAAHYFRLYDGPFHDAVPVDLVRLVGAGAYGLSKFKE